MMDLYEAVVVMCLLGLVAFLLTSRLSRRVRMNCRLVTILLATVGIVVAIRWLQDSVMMLRLLPVENAIVYANPLPLLLGVLTGALWCQSVVPRWRRVVLIVVCLSIGLSLAFRSLVGDVPICSDQWKNDVCLQTTRSSCSAAAAATLLRFHGVAATEQEMANLCLTNDQGTSIHGLYRGLRIKTRDTDLRVRIGRGSVADLDDSIPLPVILDVRLTSQVQAVDPRYADDWGWDVGRSHTVVLFGFLESDRVEVGDPGVGRENWDGQALEDLWSGVYIYLERVPLVK